MRRRPHRPALTLLVAGAGLLGATAIAAAAGLLPGPVLRHAPSWWGGEPARTGRDEAIAGGTFLAGLVLLTAAWLALVRSAPSVRRTVGLTVLWSLPLLAGTPAASHDVHAYLAHGVMLDRGLDPSAVGPDHLPTSSITEAVDPRWRGVPAPYGPIALAVSRLAALVGQHHQIGGLLVLRLVACLGVALAGACLVALLARTRAPRGTLLAIVAASPLTLVSLVSASHHEGLLVGLVMAALLAHAQGRLSLAYALAAAATLTKVPGLVVLGGLVAHDLWAARLPAWQVLARAAATSAAVLGVCALLVPRPLGWLQALSTPGLGHTKWAPVSLAARLLPGDEHLWRLIGQGAAVVLVALLLLTARGRPVTATVGWSLLAVGLLGPVLYPWYLAPAAFVLVATPGVAGRRVALLAGGLGNETGLPRLGHVGLLLGR